MSNEWPDRLRKKMSCNSKQNRHHHTHGLGRFKWSGRSLPLLWVGGIMGIASWSRGRSAEVGLHTTCIKTCNGEQGTKWWTSEYNHHPTHLLPQHISRSSHVLPCGLVGHTHNRLLNTTPNMSKYHDHARKEPANFMGPLLPNAIYPQGIHWS